MVCSGGCWRDVGSGFWCDFEVGLWGCSSAMNWLGGGLLVVLLAFAGLAGVCDVGV